MKRVTLCRIITILLPVTGIILFLIRDQLISATSYFPPCMFYSVYHLYCPSCGNTRSVIALLHGDILSSLRYNIVIMISIIFTVLGYMELASYSLGKHVKALPRKLGFYISLIIVLILYWILRNLIPYLTP